MSSIVVSVGQGGQRAVAKAGSAAGKVACKAAKAVRARSRRVILLISFIFVMGIADLVMTLTYMKHSGMFELNPIARMLAGTGEPAYLAAFKLFTMTISTVALYIGRRHRAGEIGAWLCAAILLALMLHWNNYNQEIASLTTELSTMAMYGHESDIWVRIE